MRGRWIPVSRWSATAMFLAVSLLLGAMIGNGSVKAYEVQNGQEATLWAASLRLIWDFLTCFYLFIPLLVFGFCGLKFLSSPSEDGASQRRSHTFATLVAFSLMLLALLFAGLRSQNVRW